MAEVRSCTGIVVVESFFLKRMVVESCSSMEVVNTCGMVLEN